jgi:hypothetical protein
MAPGGATPMIQIGQPLTQTGALRLQNRRHIFGKNLKMPLILGLDPLT